jgi:hypothetical protein
MKQTWIILGVISIIIFAVLRLVTVNGSLPAWAAYLRPVAFIAALICYVLSGQHRGISILELYNRRTRQSLFIGLVCLVLIPIGLWVLYSPLLCAADIRRLQ